MRLNEINNTYNTNVLDDVLIESFFKHAKGVRVLNESTRLYEFDTSKLKSLIQRGKDYAGKAKEGFDAASRKLWITATNKFSQAGGDNQVVQAVTNHMKKYGKGYVVAAAVLGALAGMPEASAADVDSMFAELDTSKVGSTEMNIQSDGGVGTDKAHDMMDTAHKQDMGNNVWGGKSPDEIKDFFLHKLSKDLGTNITADTPLDGGHKLGDLLDWKISKDFQGGKDMGSTYADITNSPQLKQVAQGT